MIERELETELRRVRSLSMVFVSTMFFRATEALVLESQVGASGVTWTRSRYLDSEMV